VYPNPVGRGEFVNISVEHEGEVNGLDGCPQTQQPASWLPSDNKDPNQEMYPSMNRNHVSIINHLLPDTFLVDGVQIAHYLNREVGDEELWLYNLDLDRNARFQAQLEIKAGKHLNPFYEYPSAPAKEVFASYNVTTNTYDYALADNGIFSKEDPFYIDPFSTAVLIAEDSIHDVGMVVDGSVIQNLQEQLVCTETYRDPERYQKRNESSDEFITKAPEARVFPNPIKSGGIVSLQNLAQGNNSISLRSISGLIIFSETIYQNTDEYVQITIPSGLSPGVYLIQTRSGGTTETIKLLVQ
jgi:hypothetical protein